MKLGHVAVVAALATAWGASNSLGNGTDLAGEGFFGCGDPTWLAARPTPGTDSWPCPPDSLYGQPSTSCDEYWGGITSAIGPDFDYTCYDNFPTGVGLICGVHFYGLSMKWNQAWYVCDPVGMMFEIAFYTNVGGSPGTVACGPHTVTPSCSIVETCSGYDFYYFEVPTLPPCNMPEGGWVSIKSISSDNDCLLLWLNSDTGDLSAYQRRDGNLEHLSLDLAFCLTGVYVDPWGACCDEPAGACDDWVAMSDCLAQGKRFQANTLCQDMTPLCGQATGACCYEDGACCLTKQSACGRVGDINADGVINFDDISPFVEVLSGSTDYNLCAADCNRDGSVDFNDINPFVDIVGGEPSISGTFLGYETPCAACPVVVPCPAGATLEDEACYSGTNEGCNAGTPSFGRISCGETICGTSYFDGSTRDTDWFVIDGADRPYMFTLTAKAEFDLQLMLIQDTDADCADFEFWYVFADAGQEAQFSSDCFSADRFYVWVGPQFATTFECTATSAQYWVTLECLTCGYPGACCTHGDCRPGMTEWHCQALGGTWLIGQDCDPNPCPPPALGDTCADPFLVTEPLPFSASGDTSGDFGDDYDEICPYDAPGSPDVVYRYIPTGNVWVLISLCFGETCYDSKLYVYEGGCPGTLLACNDDHCTTACYPFAYVSQPDYVHLEAGHEYYIVVDGYGGEAGTYYLQIEEIFPGVIEQPPLVGPVAGPTTN